MVEFFPASGPLVLLILFAIGIAIAVRVIMSRPTTGVGLAWLILVAALPLVGAVVYLLIGERRVGMRRGRKIAALRLDYAKLSEAAIGDGLTDIDWSRHPPAAERLDQLGRQTAGSPTVRGSQFELFSNTEEILQTIARDIDNAATSVLIEFYIWQEGGAADLVYEALLRAAKRGVACRVLVDSIGARPWLASGQPQNLRDAGVDVLPALPVGPLRAFFSRTDLRLHRKIVVVDGRVAWTGSMNLVDPRLFKQNEGVGQWVDAMVRLDGAAAPLLGATMIGDWVLESSESIYDIIAHTQLKLVEPNGPADVQVVASGPVETKDGLLQMLLALINAAHHRLILTTPYLIPDPPMLLALRGAAGRGVKVTLIVPEVVDSFWARHASRSYYDDLLEMGVEIRLFRDGLLHTKSIMADGTMSMFGTANFDYRSLWLNYEVALFIYGQEFAEQLCALQESYIEASDKLDQSEWATRSFGQQLVENTLRLASPLL